MDIFIINNEDKNNDSFKYLNALKEIYHSIGSEYRVILCRSRSEIIDKALYYSTIDSTRYIFSIGGNKTLNGVINGMVFSKKPLVVIPCGNNDFGDDICLLTKDTEIDLGRVNYDYFIGKLSLGLDALISSKFESLPSDKKLSYIRELLRVCPNYLGLDVKMDSTVLKLDKRVSLMSFYNCSCFGDKRIVDSSLTDGKLDLIVADNNGRLRLFYELLKFWLTEYKDTKNISYRQVSKAHLEFNYPISYTFDGISKIDGELDVCLLPSKLLVKLGNGKKC